MFARRALAFAVDYLLATLVALALLGPVALVFPEQLSLGVGLFPPVVQCDALVEDSPENSVMVCEKPSLFNTSQYTTYATARRSILGVGEISVQLRIPVTASDEPAGQVAPTGLVTVLLLILGSSILLQNGRQTPGKYFVGIAAVGKGCALCRELRRLSPILGLAVLSLIASQMPLDTQLFIALKYTTAFEVIWLMILAWVLGYYLRFAGNAKTASPWNDATGFVMVKR